jgi:tRNA-dependent cyclodipeptide synthase
MRSRNYKLKITPNTATTSVWDSSRCLYGVSVGSKNGDVDSVVDGFLWASTHFSRCGLLLGDSLYRFTLQIQRGLDELTATAEARSAGQEHLAAILQRLPRTPEIIRCSDILHAPDFSLAFSKFERHFNLDADFNSSIMDDARSFVQRQMKSGRLALPEAQGMGLAIRYLVEEVAVYSYLADQGWLVDVYLGDELPTLARIINGDIPSVAGALSSRINISLKN